MCLYIYNIGITLPLLIIHLFVRDVFARAKINIKVNIQIKNGEKLFVIFVPILYEGEIE